MLFPCGPSPPSTLPPLDIPSLLPWLTHPWSPGLKIHLLSAWWHVLIVFFSRATSFKFLGRWKCLIWIGSHSVSLQPDWKDGVGADFPQLRDSSDRPSNASQFNCHFERTVCREGSLSSHLISFSPNVSPSVWENQTCAVNWGHLEKSSAIEVSPPSELLYSRIEIALLPQLQFFFMWWDFAE